MHEHEHENEHEHEQSCNYIIVISLSEFGFQTIYAAVQYATTKNSQNSQFLSLCPQKTGQANYRGCTILYSAALYSTVALR
jgi:hypothetical protein